jgi:hypothetical protein
VNLQTRKLRLHVREQSSILDIFESAIDALYVCNVVEHRHVETICEMRIENSDVSEVPAVSIFYSEDKGSRFFQNAGRHFSIRPHDVTT